MTAPARPARASSVRRVVATAGTVVVSLRVALWIAKALATAGTVDTALQMLGLHGPVDEFEAAFDAMVEPLVIAVRAGWDAYQAARAT